MSEENKKDKTFYYILIGFIVILFLGGAARSLFSHKAKTPDIKNKAAASAVAPTRTHCGNCICDPDETCENCPMDCCGCGDGRCSKKCGENEFNCPQDCR